MTSVNRVIHANIRFEMLVMVNTILFTSFVQLTVATSFETQLKIITCKKEGEKKYPPPRISAQHLSFQNLP